MLINDFPYHTNTGEGLRTFPHTPPHLYAPHLNPIFYPYGLNGMGWYGGQGSGLGAASVPPVPVEQTLSKLMVESQSGVFSDQARREIGAMIQHIRANWSSFFDANGSRKPPPGASDNVWVQLDMLGTSPESRNWLITNRFHWNPANYQVVSRSPTGAPSSQPAPGVSDWGEPPAWGAGAVAQPPQAGGTATQKKTGWGWWPWIIGAVMVGGVAWYTMR